MNTIFAATTSPFMKSGKESDKNGNKNLFLTVLAGKMPNKCMVLNGTQALKQEVYTGATYLFQAVEGDVDPTFGRQFNLINLGELSVMDCIDVPNKLGAAIVIDVVNEEVVATESVE